MSVVARFYHSSIGKKIIVAVTGLLLIAYVIGHLVGNLQIFLGRDRINEYAQFLHDLGPWLWVARLTLLAAFVAHIIVTIQLVVENRAARPHRYAEKVPVRSTFASRTMALSGLLVLCFVIYHVLHFTVRVTNPGLNDLLTDTQHPNVYAVVVTGFQNPFVCLFYLLSVFLLCLHLSHGFSSFIQTLGLTTRGLAPRLALGGRVLAWAIFVGYASIPVAVLLDILKL